MHKDKQKKQNMLVIFLGLFFVMACIGNNVSTPTAFPVLTNTPCSEIPYTPAVQEGKPVFYFVLIDGTLNYDLKHVEDAKKALENVLSIVLQTGDKIIVSWLNDKVQYYGIESSILFNNVFVIQSLSIPVTPTFPPTLEDFSTATVTPTSLGQLRQTEIARTVGAAKEQEQAFIQETINNYFCQKGATVAKIEEIKGIVEQVKRDSINSFIEQFHRELSLTENYEASKNNPFFEVLSESSKFIVSECDLNIYSNCILVIFSDMDDFRQNLPSDQVPYSSMNKRIDVVPILYGCQFMTACDKKTNKWSEHFAYFNSRSLEFVLNRDADKDVYNESISNDLINRILKLKLNN